VVGWHECALFKQPRSKQCSVPDRRKVEEGDILDDNLIAPMGKALAPAVSKRIIKELAELSATKPCEGISVEFSEDNVREIYADIEGPTGTPFEGGVFRVKLLLGDDFPDGPPHGYFLTKTFHPNVSEAGDICVNVLKKDWKPDVGIRHVLLVGALLQSCRRCEKRT
jgi:ubiquitin-protein ligase